MIPSLLQIPSSVSDSKLHSVLPNNGKGDFTFDRSTGATRINKDGLIEEVGYFSSELVQNGDFSELGSEKATNGNFDNGSTNWTLIGDASIGNGVCTFFDTGSNTNSQLISQTAILANKTYKLVFDVTRYVAGSIQIIFGGGSSVSVNITGGVGTYTVYVVNGSSTTWLIKRNGGYPNFDFDIDNVSVKQVDPNDRWTLGTGWSYGNGVATRTSQSGSSSLGANGTTLTVGKTYKCSMTVSNYSNGAVRFTTDSLGFTLHSGNGTYTEILTSTGTAFNVKGNADFAGSVSNISVVEVQGDRPRLSYDITNGVVEDKPHLLLEPSSTNLITFSDLLNNFTGGRATVSTVSFSAPDGSSQAILFAAESGTSSTHRAYSNEISVTNAASYSVSIFVKKGTAKKIEVGFPSTSELSIGFNSAVFDFDNETITNGSFVKYPNGWYRLKISDTVNATIAARLFVYVYDASGNKTYSADGTENVYLWGAMVEQQAFSTSYIPTAGTTITRAAETCNNSKPSVNSTEGVLYCEIAALADDGTIRAITISDGTVNDFISIRYSVLVDLIRAEIKDGGVQQFFFQTTANDFTQFIKLALQYKANDCQLYINGTQVATDTSATMPSGLDRINFDNGSGNQDFYGKVKGLAVYNEALSESQLFQLTGVTATSIYNNFVTRTGSFTVEALNEVKKVIDNL